MKNIIQLSGTTILLFILFSFHKNEINNKKPLSSSSLSNQDFKTVKIGSQTWMAENLDVDHYRNGDKIPQAKDWRAWDKSGEDSKGFWTYYIKPKGRGFFENNSDPKMYGKLYNYYAVHDDRGLAPAGWHVPTYEEWNLLKETLGSNAGKKMKSSSGWEENGNGTNESGFNGLPGGYLDKDQFYWLGYKGYWWSSTEIDIDNTETWFLTSSGGFMDLLNFVDLNYSSGASVRCIKDEK